MLKSDGTYDTDVDGNPVPTYDNEDIMTFARIWTGFLRSKGRGSQEQVQWKFNIPGSLFNFIDPTYLDAYRRDYFPKLDLYDQYIGDRYPLCVELPQRPFLRVGAKYRFLGAATAHYPYGRAYPVQSRGHAPSARISD
jgi:hypothetical protein